LHVGVNNTLGLIVGILNICEFKVTDTRKGLHLSALLFLRNM
jgi:hypothetical protein